MEFDDLEEESATPEMAEEITDWDNIFENTDFEDLEETEEINLFQDLEFPDLTPEELAALQKSPLERTWQEVELADNVRHSQYETQKSFLTDEETGEVLRDADGKLISCNRNVRGAQRPDGFLEDEEGIHIREDKSYGDLYNLMNNIREQTEKRREGYGEDVDLTYVVAPRFNVGEAERLQEFCEQNGVNLEFQLK